MSANLAYVKAGLAIVLLGLFFNIGLGVAFGVNEDAFKDYVAEGVAAHPEVHDGGSNSGIWRYAQRAHFHAGGVAAFCLGLIFLVMLSNMTPGWQKTTSILIGLGSVYPLSWFAMYLLAPSIGRSAAHDHIITQLLTYVGVLSLVLGFVFLIANLYFGLFRDQQPT